MTETAAHNVAQNFDPPPTVLGKYCRVALCLSTTRQGTPIFVPKMAHNFTWRSARVRRQKYVLGEPLGYGHVERGLRRHPNRHRSSRRPETAPQRASTERRNAQTFRAGSPNCEQPGPLNAVTIFDSGHQRRPKLHRNGAALGETLDRLIQREARCRCCWALELLSWRCVHSRRRTLADHPPRRQTG